MLRRLLTPVSRGLVLGTGDRALGALAEATDEERQKLLVFMIVVPGTESLAGKNATSLSKHCRLVCVLNGFSKKDTPRWIGELSPHASVRLSTVPHFPAKHGTVLTVLLRSGREDFAVIDADCFVREPDLLCPVPFEPNEYVAVPDHPHFYDVNQLTKQRFPRTHHLIFNVEVIRLLMVRHRITAEKYRRAPSRLAPELARLGYGNHNFPRSHLRHFDTLLLVMSMAMHDGFEPRWLESDPGSIVHWKHVSRHEASRMGT